MFTSLIVLFYHLSNIPNDDNSTTPYRVDTITDKIFNEHAPFFLFNHFRSKQIFPRFGTAYDNHRDPAVYLTCLPNAAVLQMFVPSAWQIGRHHAFRRRPSCAGYSSNLGNDLPELYALSDSLHGLTSVI